DKKAKEHKKSDDVKKAIEFIENASTIIEDLVIDNAPNMKKYIQLVSASGGDDYNADAAIIKSAASALRRAKRKMDSITNKAEQLEIRKRVEKEKELINI